MENTRESRATAVWVGLGLLISGLLLPWATVNDGEFILAESGISSNATVLGFALPGWVVGISAIIIGVLVTWTDFRRLAVALSAYGLGHVCFMLLTYANQPQATPSLGILIAVLGCLTQLVTALAWVPEYRPAQRRREVSGSRWQDA